MAVVIACVCIYFGDDNDDDMCESVVLNGVYSKYLFLIYSEQQHQFKQPSTESSTEYRVMQ